MDPSISATFFEWRPEMYSGVFDSSGNVAAYLDAYPLKPTAAAQLLDGVIEERDLEVSMFLQRADNHDNCSFYIGSLYIDERYHPIFKAMLFASLLKLRVRHLTDLAIQRTTLLMTVATNEGTRIAQRLGATKIHEGIFRKDGLDLYGLQITPNLLAVKAAFADRFPLVQIDFRPSE